MLDSIREELSKFKTDKLMIIVCLIFPICVNILIGFELNKGVISHIPMAIVDYDNSQLSRQLTQYFEENDSFLVKYYPKDQKTLETLLDTSKARVGMVIPKNFSADVTSLKSPTIMMLYDGSHMSMVSVAKAKASEILLTARVGGTIKQLQGRYNHSYDEAYTMAMPISFEARTLYNPAKNFGYFMLPGYGTIICQLGIGLTAVLCVTYPREEKKRRNALGYIMGKVIFYGTLGSIAVITNLFVQVYCFHLPCRGSIFEAYGLSILFMFAVAALTVALSAWLSNRVLGMAVAGLMLIPNSIMAGYTWPVLSMLPFYKWTAKLIPFTHYGRNIRDLLLKGSISNANEDIFFLCAFMLVMIVVGTLGMCVRRMGPPREEDHR